MSNSDNTSNSDKKLDALYKLTQQSESELPEIASDDDVSPPDIDASLMAAARKATAVGSSSAEETPISNPSNSISWQQRYGWATAATVLLTSVLFISQLDTQPESAAISTTESFGADEVLSAPMRAEEAALADSAASVDTALSNQVAPMASSRSAPAPKASGGFASYSKQARSQAAESIQKERIQADSIEFEEIAVTSRHRAQKFEDAPLSVQAQCLDYPALLISKVCTNPLASSAIISLRANVQSECAGQSLNLPADNDLPEPDVSSTLSRFVLKADNPADPNQPPTEEIVCQSGKLIIQSLARGR